MYLTHPEVEALLAAAPSVVARTLMLVQWRAGLRISEALDVDPREVALCGEHPTLALREGKGGRTRAVPLHPKLADAIGL